MDHDELHPESADVLYSYLLVQHDMVDVWKEQFSNERSYTWVREGSSLLS